ncbi:hypothetical protein [Fibrobacter sp.]|uniref:hypothetical protein n=1 Tax=Fibrobacter sp. TaxID=35828 RepID=UPI003864ABED
MIIYIPPQARENVSEFLSDFENTLIELDVPVWKVALGGLFLVALFVGTFIGMFHLMMWLL